MPDKPKPIIDKRFAAILVIAVIAAIVPFFLAGAKGNIAWETEVDAAKAKASRLKRPMLIYFTASWCLPCQQMKKHVFPNAKVGKTLAELYVPLKVDLSDRGPVEGEFAMKYGIRGIPTMVITNAQGNVIDEHAGPIGAGELVEWLVGYHNQPVRTP